MGFVVDASLAAAWFLPDEHNAAADRIMTELAVDPGLAPSLFWFELRHLFLTAERGGRLRPGEAAMVMAQLRRFPIMDEGGGDDGLTLVLAQRHGLSGYDASYLALAIARRSSLATLDRKLAAAAHLEGVAVRPARP